MHIVAMIINGIVVNLAVWDGITPWNPGDEYTLVDIMDNSNGVGIGWSYGGDGFMDPIPQGDD